MFFFALGVNPTARDAGEGGGSDLVFTSYALRSVVRTSSCPCSLATQI